MKLHLELTDRHLDLIKEELRIPAAHYEYLMAAFAPGEQQEIPEEYNSSLRILKVRVQGLGLNNTKEDCVIKEALVDFTL